MREEGEQMTIGQLAAAAEVGVETVRFYQREGLVAEPPRPSGGIRRYGSADLGRLRFIKSAQRLGFALSEVADLLRLDDGAGCGAAKARAEARLVEVRLRLDDLRRMETALADLVERCATSKGKIRCPLIAALAE